MNTYPDQAQSNTVRQPGRIQPGWIEDLTTFYHGRIARQFVLHFNITDFIIDLSERRELSKGDYIRKGDVVGIADQPETMREYLHQFLFDRQQGLRCQAIYTYSLAGGLTADDVEHRGIGTALEHEIQGTAAQRIQDAYKLIRPKQPRRTGQLQGEQEVDLPNNLTENFKVLGHMLRQKYYQKTVEDSTNTDSFNPDVKRRETPIAVILDYAEKLIPYHLGEGQGDREQLQALEVVQRWALDPLIRQTDNIIILLTTNIGQIPPSVFAEGSGCRAIRVPLPDEYEREAFIRYKMTRAKSPFVKLDTNDFGSSIQEQARRLARATQGMRLTDIDNVSRRVIVEFRKRKLHNRELSSEVEIMKSDDVQRAKAEVIQAQSAQLLEIVPPVRGFNEIGGLDNLKEYLSKRTKLMLTGQYSPIVPSGLLLAGPPGTGKTIIAEALATESGFNLVKMRNIQDKWIGSSERNLDLVLNLLKDLHPVIVFVDEFDQAMVRRDTGQSGDSGVGARMFARILEEMSNAANRGRILWVAATNRADIIDAALLRRFDRVVPLLTPDIYESCRIFATMLRVIVKQSDGTIQIAYGGDLKQSGNIDANGRSNPTQEDIDKFLPLAEFTANLGLTGASIEIIVRRAIEIVYEQRLNASVEQNQAELPLLEAEHLIEAIKDFKPNYNRLTYDYQSLLAIRSCNFSSILPTLPKSGVYGRIQGDDGQVDPEKLDKEINEIERTLNSKI